MCLAAYATGSLFRYLQRELDTVTAVSAVFVLLTMPRVFAHLHWVGLDGPLLSASILVWVHFCQRQRGGHHRLLWSIFLGLAISTKVTGCFLIPAMILQLVTVRHWDAIGLLAGIGRAVCIFVALNPSMWSSPGTAYFDFFSRNLVVRQGSQFDIPTMFFGQIRHTATSLPWFGGWFWLLMTIPLGWLAFMAAGIRQITKMPIAPDDMRMARGGIVRDALPFLCLLPLIRCLPGIPPHDGERLMLPSFAFAAIIIAVGVGACWHWRSGFLFRIVARVTVIGVALFSIQNLKLWRLGPLSYFNLVGISSAASGRDTVEVAYYWDRLQFDSVRQICDEFSRTDAVCVSEYPAANCRLASRWKLTRNRFEAISETGWKLYLVQNRRGTMSALDRSLLQHQPPVHVFHAQALRSVFSSSLRLPAIFVFRRWQVDREIQRLETTSIRHGKSLKQCDHGT